MLKKEDQENIDRIRKGIIILVTNRVYVIYQKLEVKN